MPTIQGLCFVLAIAAMVTGSRMSDCDIENGCFRCTCTSVLHDADQEIICKVVKCIVTSSDTICGRHFPWPPVKDPNRCNIKRLEIVGSAEDSPTAMGDLNFTVDYNANDQLRRYPKSFQNLYSFTLTGTNFQRVVQTDVSDSCSPKDPKCTEQWNPIFILGSDRPSDNEETLSSDSCDQGSNNWNLATLNLSNNQLVDIPHMPNRFTLGYEFYVKMLHLRTIDLSNNTITNIIKDGQNALLNLIGTTQCSDRTPLQALNLSGNKINEIPENAFFETPRANKKNALCVGPLFTDGGIIDLRGNPITYPLHKSSFPSRCCGGHVRLPDDLNCQQYFETYCEWLIPTDCIRMDQLCYNSENISHTLREVCGVKVDFSKKNPYGENGCKAYSRQYCLSDKEKNYTTLIAVSTSCAVALVAMGAYTYRLQKCRRENGSHSNASESQRLLHNVTHVQMSTATSRIFGGTHLMSSMATAAATTGDVEISEACTCLRHEHMLAEGSEVRNARHQRDINIGEWSTVTWQGKRYDRISVRCNIHQLVQLAPSPHRSHVLRTFAEEVIQLRKVTKDWRDSTREELTASQVLSSLRSPDTTDSPAASVSVDELLEQRSGRARFAAPVAVQFEPGLSFLMQPSVAQAKSLQDIGTGLKRFSLKERVDMLLQVGELTAYLHEKDVVHGDIRAANVFLLEDNQLVLSFTGLITLLSSLTLSVYETDEMDDGSVRTAPPEIFRLRPRWATVGWSAGKNREDSPSIRFSSDAEPLVSEVANTPVDEEGRFPGDEEAQHQAASHQKGHRRTMSLGSVMTKSVDSYGFGMLSWQVICGCGQKPYADLNTADQVIRHVLKGGRPKITGNVPNALKQLMLNCWESSEEKRPSFADIVECLAKICNDLSQTES